EAHRPPRGVAHLEWKSTTLLQSNKEKINFLNPLKELIILFLKNSPL
ncbi:hypothetical protein BSG1_10463, partial [Bacillus sp. SG-1]